MVPGLEIKASKRLFGNTNQHLRSTLQTFEYLISPVKNVYSCSLMTKPTLASSSKGIKQRYDGQNRSAFSLNRVSYLSEGV